MKFQLEVKNLDFSYGNKKIIKNLNMNIKSGSFISIVGPNGSGKSTFLKIISTYLKPQKGIVLLDSMDINKLSRKEKSRRISVVPQNTSLEFDFKVKDIVMMGRHPHINRFRKETAKDIKAVEDAMFYTNTMMLSHRMFNELSGGEKQRVILAQALAQGPEILLLDEPVSHLDLQHQVEILDLIRKMSISESLTVIAVLHDLNMASNYSDYIMMLKEGRIKYDGAPGEVLNKSNIMEVFNINAYINGNPVSGKPYIYTLSSIPPTKQKLKVHIICGGGSGQDLIRELSHEGFNISTGVLNIGDSDWAISKEYKLDMVEEIPFVEISHDAYVENKNLILKADVVILTEVYFSNANLKNLEILLEKEFKDKIIYVFKDGIDRQDFAGGEAIKLFQQIKERNNFRVINKDKLVKALVGAGENYEN